MGWTTLVEYGIPVMEGTLPIYQPPCRPWDVLSIVLYGTEKGLQLFEISGYWPLSQCLCLLRICTDSSLAYHMVWVADLCL